MPAVRYTAKRSIRSGHTLDGIYELTLKLRAMDRGRVPVKNISVAEDGTTETVVVRRETRWSCNTIPLTGTDAADMREFLDSVETGESFEFDPQNDAGASPDDLRTSIIVSKGYTERRAARTGTANPYVSGDYFTFGFQLREL